MAQILSPGGVKPTPWRFNPALVEPRYVRLSRSLILLPLWRSSTANNAGLHNLGRGGHEIVLSANNGLDASWVITKGGDALRIPEGSKSDEIQVNNGGVQIPAGSDFTFSVVYTPRWAASVGNPGLWRSEGSGSGNGDTWVIATGSTRDIWIRLGGTDLLKPNVTNYFPQGERHVYTAIVRSGTNVEFWFDGALVESATHAVATPAFTVHQFGWQFSAGASNSMLGDYEALILEDRAWTGGEVQAWHTDPFGPFRPARRRRVFAAAAAPATGRTTTFLTTLGVA